MKIFFTWWNRQTIGTFLKTLFFGKYVGKDELGNKYYKNNKNSDKNLGLGLEKLEHKTIYDLINKSNYEELAKVLADASLESNEVTVNNIVNGAYMKGIVATTICDEIVRAGFYDC